MTAKEYRRLTWARARSSFGVAFLGRSSLWLGKDHVLCVESNNYVENYKRFYFRDIQAITIVNSKRRVIWNWVLGVLTTLSTGAWVYGFFSGLPLELGPILTAVGVTAFFAVPLAINSMLGPTCNCHIRTAVQAEELPSLNRLRRARRVFGILRPLIASAQGTLPPEEIPARMRALSESQITPAQPAPVPGAATEPARYVIDDLNAPPRIIP